MQPHQVVALRFRNGPTEFHFAATPPKVGDRLQRGGDEWEVIAVEEDDQANPVVTLEAPRDGRPRPER